MRPSLVNSGRQSWAKSRCREWMSRCAACCVRGPRCSTGRSFVQGSMASHSQSTWVELRSRVRISSNWRCGMCRLRKECSWKSSACLPARVRKARDGGLTGAEDAWGFGRIQSFGQRREHHCDLLRGGFQTIQRSVASSTERRAAGLTPKRLDLLGMTMLAIANQRVDLGIGDPAIRALRVGTGKALGVHALGCSSAAFDLAPGAYRPRRWLFTRRGSGGETTGGAIVWAAGLEQTVEPAALGPSS